MRLRYFVKRSLITVFVIFLAASGLFFLFRSMPGSFIDYLLQSGATPEQAAAVRAKWGLDDPLYVQYVRYIVNLLSADMGNSYRFGEPVWSVVKPRMFNSFVLAAPALTTAFVVGSLIGGFLGERRGTRLESYGIVLVSVFGTIPSFFTGILLLILLSFKLQLFPFGNMISVGTLQQLGDNASVFQMMTTTDFWWHYTLPFLTIVLRYSYLPALIMRTSVVEVKDQDFMYYHRMKGLSPTSQLRHLITHASLPVITLFPVTMTRAIGGLVLVETVFNWPGIGSLLIESVLFRDYPVVQLVFVLAAIWVVLGNYLVDVVYGLIDPRISIEGQADS